VSWIRLGSVTYSCNQNQSCIFLDSQQTGSTLTVTAPANPNIALLGHYMLFVLNDQGVPSEAPIIHISSPVGDAIRTQRRFATVPATVNLTSISRKIAKDESRLPIVVGVTPSCPYGIGACWGGAFGALNQLSNIKIVRPFPDAIDSLAFVCLQEDLLPDLDEWRIQFAKYVNGSYNMRGIEMTISGLVTEHHGRPTLTGTATRPELPLTQLQAANKVQWNIKTRDNRPASDFEASAFDRLVIALIDCPTGVTVQVTGPLMKNGEDFLLQVRGFEIPRRGLVQQAKGLVKGMRAWLSNCSCFP
jgi:galactose oxidase